MHGSNRILLAINVEELVAAPAQRIPALRSGQMENGPAFTILPGAGRKTVCDRSSARLAFVKIVRLPAKRESSQVLGTLCAAHCWTNQTIPHQSRRPDHGNVF